MCGLFLTWLITLVVYIHTDEMLFAVISITGFMTLIWVYLDEKLGEIKRMINLKTEREICPKCNQKMYPESIYIRVCPYCGHKVDLRKEK